MKLIKLTPEENWKKPIEKFGDLLFFPVENIECLVFSDCEIFRFRGLFPFLNPLGHNIAIVNISDDPNELYDIVKNYPKFIYICNGNMFVHLISEPTALFAGSYKAEILNAYFPILERYTDMEGNVNPLLIFISLIKKDFPNIFFLEKIAQIGFPYKKIIEKDRRKIVGDKIFELIPNQTEGVIYSGFKKEVNLLIEEYPSFFGVLPRARGIKENIPNFIEKKNK